MLVNSIPSTALPILLLLAMAAGCGSEETEPVESIQPATPGPSADEDSKPTMVLSSAAFENNATIDDQHTAEGDDSSPPLSWSGAPPETTSFALICDDPDSDWVHWVVFNIPADVTELPAGLAKESEPEAVPGVRQGANSWPSKNVGYRGPAPPAGDGEHEYVFTLYALDQALELDSSATNEDVLDAMSGHVLAEGRLIGVVER